MNAPAADIVRSCSFHCDPHTHRVSVTDAAGRIVLEFGGFGRQPGAFDTPIDATLVMPEFFGEPGAAAEPWLAVADYGNRRVQVFELDGALVGVIDEEILGASCAAPCRLIWRDPVLDVEGVDGARSRIHLGAALMTSDGQRPSPSVSARWPIGC